MVYLSGTVIDLNELQFFKKFDFVNMGTSEPVFNWPKGAEGPGNANCHGKDQQQCDKEIRCATKNVRVNERLMAVLYEFAMSRNYTR